MISHCPLCNVQSPQPNSFSYLCTNTKCKYLNVTPKFDVKFNEYKIYYYNLILPINKKIIRIYANNHYTILTLLYQPYPKTISFDLFLPINSNIIDSATKNIKKLLKLNSFK